MEKKFFRKQKFVTSSGYSVFLIFLIFTAVTAKIKAQTQIPYQFYGINAWMPDYVGGTQMYGKLDWIWPSQGTNSCTNHVSDLQTKFIRYGGGELEKHSINSIYQEVVAFVAHAKACGMEPIIQIPFAYNLALPNGYNSSQLLSWNIQAAVDVSNPNNIGYNYQQDIATFVSELVTNYNVKYFAISNEPDNWGNLNLPLQTTPASNLVSCSTAEQVASYFQPVSNWIRQAAYPTQIIILGPTLSYYGSGAMETDLIKSGSGPYDIIRNSPALPYEPYCDIYSFNTYPFDGSSNQKRSTVISKPTTGFEANLSSLNTRLNNQWPSSNTEIGILEMNVDYNNPSFSGCSSPDYVCNDIEGTGTNSFLAGQWMAEMFARGLVNKSQTNGRQVACMIPWAIHEALGDPSDGGDLGLLGDDFNQFSQPPSVLKKRSTYHHLKFMASFFCAGTLQWANLTVGPNDPLVKSFCAYGCGVGGVNVMIMNQNLASKTYYIEVDNITPQTSD
jgi:hypothetical protein